VLVWLGETAENSDIALEGIRTAAEDESINALYDKQSSKQFQHYLDDSGFGASG
jgi:hypothetical protein